MASPMGTGDAIHVVYRGSHGYTRMDLRIGCIGIMTDIIVTPSPRNHSESASGS